MIIDDLITNRTQEDASYAAELAAKGQNMTEEEWAAYLAGLRGAYNYTDLNRVTEAMEYINDRLSGYGYTSGYKSIEISREQEPSGRLPKGYTELEYLESSGTQYIDTGFNANQDTQVVMDCTLLSNTTSAAAFFGARNEDASSAQQSFIAWSTGNGASIRSDYFGDNLSATYSLVGRRIVINKNKNVCTFDGKTVTNKTNTGQLALSLYLFGSHSGATANLRGAVIQHDSSANAGAISKAKKIFTALSRSKIKFSKRCRIDIIFHSNRNTEFLFQNSTDFHPCIIRNIVIGIMNFSFFRIYLSGRTDTNSVKSPIRM